MATAIAVLPEARAGRLTPAPQRRWLSRGSLSVADPSQQIFARTLSAAALPPVEQGLAALRLWGQTGVRPDVWLAAVELVHLEARLDQLCLHALSGGDLPRAELNTVFDLLQEVLAGDTTKAFQLVGEHGYLRSDSGMPTAPVSAAAVVGMAPDVFVPEGDAADQYHKLTGEIQLYLHEHPYNRRREDRGLLPVNSIWLWGGGRAPAKTVRRLPPLFGDDPLFRGYWESGTGVMQPWPGNFSECVDFARGDLIVVTPDAAPTPGELAGYLAELRQIHASGRVQRLILLFRDGLTADIGRFDRFRFWRGVSPLFETAVVDRMVPC